MTDKASILSLFGVQKKLYKLYQWPMTNDDSDYILTRFCIHFCYILTAFWQHSDYILTTLWLYSDFILATFWLHSDYILATFCYSLTTFRLHTDNHGLDEDTNTESIQYKYIHEKITMKEGTRLFGSQWPTSGRVAAFAAASSTLLEYSTAADTNVSKPLI